MVTLFIIYASFYLLKVAFKVQYEGFLNGTAGKESAANAGDCKRYGFDPWVRKITCRRKWQPTPIILPGISMDREAWKAIVHRVAKSQTHLSTHAYSHALSLMQVLLHHCNFSQHPPSKHFNITLFCHSQTLSFLYWIYFKNYMYVCVYTDKQQNITQS